MSEPLISVIIPVYNSEKYLAATLKSVQQQTFTDFEVICVDDGSTDNSAQILQQFARADARFKVHRQQNAGGSASRNKGLDLAAGKFIAFLDNDDIYHPQYLEILYHNIMQSNADISCCSYVRFEDETYSFAPEQLQPTVNFETSQPFTDKFVRKKKIEMLMWTKLYRRELLQNIHFSEKLPAINDILFNIEILLKAAKAVVCRTPLIAYRIIATSQTQKDLSAARIEEYKNLCIAINSLCNAYPKHTPTLKKIAARYAYGMHVQEYLQRYNPQQDTERYQLLRQNLIFLITGGCLLPSKLNLRQRLTLWAFTTQRHWLLKRLKKH